MKRATFSVSTSATSIDHKALGDAIDLGQKMIAPMQLESFDKASLSLSNNKVDIEFSIDSFEPGASGLDRQALSDDVEGAE